MPHPISFLIFLLKKNLKFSEKHLGKYISKIIDKLIDKVYFASLCARLDEMVNTEANYAFYY